MGSRTMDLEKKIDLNSYLRNEYEVEEGGEQVVYVGEAQDLYFKAFYSHLGRWFVDVRGRPCLKKLKRIFYVKKRFRFDSFWPLKLGFRDEVVFKDVEVWSIVSGEYNHKFFISSGKLQTGYDYTAHYRGALVKEATEKGIEVPAHAVFDAVFAPIDEYLLDKYSEAKKIEKSNLV